MGVLKQGLFLLWENCVVPIFGGTPGESMLVCRPPLGGDTAIIQPVGEFKEVLGGEKIPACI